MEEETTSARRSTRAQAAPEWTSAETLTLLNEISSVDRDCGGHVAAFQKWKTVSGNIAAVGVHRSLDQCRRKWASLLDAYNKAKELGSFWNLDDDVRKEIRVSDDFDLEVFKAMDDHLKGGGEEGERESGAEEETTDPDPGEDHGGADGLIDDEEEDSSFEKKKNHTIVRKRRNAAQTVRKSQKLKETANKRAKPQIAPTILTEEVDEEVNLLNEQKILLATYHQSSQDQEEEVEDEVEDESEVLAEKLFENAKSIEAIVIRTPSISDDPFSADSKDAEIDFVRDQADQLIAYLGRLAQNLKQLSDAVP